MNGSNFIWSDELVADFFMKLYNNRKILEFEDELKEFKKSKEPLFTTYKNESIYEDDKYWFVTDDFEKFTNIASKEVGFGNNNTRFLTEKDADEYILLNKPIEVSLKEFNNAVATNGGTYRNVREFFKSKINP